MSNPIQDIEKVIAQASELLVRQAGVSRPPIGMDDLERIARLRGIREVITTDGLNSADGALFPSGLDYVMLLRRQRHLKRFRFTYAHEIAHTLFKPQSPVWRCAKMPSDSPTFADLDSQAIERLCDIGAAHLLMPDFLFKRYVTRLSSLIASLLPLSELFGASITAVAQRIVETRTEPLILIKWNHNKNLPDELTVEWSRQNVPSRYFIPTGARVKAGPLEAAAIKNPNAYRVGFSPYNLGTLTGVFFSESKALSFRDNKYVLTFISPDATSAPLYPTGH